MERAIRKPLQVSLGLRIARSISNRRAAARRDLCVLKEGQSMLRISSPLNATEESLITRAMDCAFAVHRELGPGFRELIYQRAYCLELESCGVRFECEKSIEVRYKAWSIPGQKVDLLLEGLLVVEIKAVPELLEVHERQVRSYLKTMKTRAGLLVNFNVTLLKDGIRRIVYT